MIVEGKTTLRKAWLATSEPDAFETERNYANGNPSLYRCATMAENQGRVTTFPGIIHARLTELI